jgi:hypothetical protein
MPLSYRTFGSWRIPEHRNPVPLAEAAARLGNLSRAAQWRRFANPGKNWENESTGFEANWLIWSRIFHPDKVLPTQGEDSFSSRATKMMPGNLAANAETRPGCCPDEEWLRLPSATAEPGRARLWSAV